MIGMLDATHYTPVGGQKPCEITVTVNTAYCARPTSIQHWITHMIKINAEEAHLQHLISFPKTLKIGEQLDQYIYATEKL